MLRIFTEMWCESTRWEKIYWSKNKKKVIAKDEEKLILCFTKIIEHWVGYN